MLVIPGIFGAVTGCYWLYMRIQIKSGVRRNIVTLLDISAATNSVVAVAETRRETLKRYRLISFHQREYLWSARHLAKTLVYIFERRGSFILTPKEVSILSRIVPLGPKEKEVILQSFSDQLSDFSESKLNSMISSSFPLKSETHERFALEYLESILDAKQPIRDVDAILQMAI